MYGQQMTTCAHNLLQAHGSNHCRAGSHRNDRYRSNLGRDTSLEPILTANEPLTDLRGCELSERERVMEACRICMSQRQNRRYASQYRGACDICTEQVLSDETAGALLSKVRHATSVQNRLADQRRDVRQRITRVKRKRRFPTGGQINADQCSADLCESMQQEQQMVGLSCMVA